MEKRCFGKLGIDVSLLGFGCMRFPVKENGEINEELSMKMLKKAYDSGVNYFDTAWPYHDGKSEPLLGKFLDTVPRDSYYLATKLPLWFVNSVDDAKNIFEQQLKRLNKDYIDFYLMHACNREVFNKMVDLGVVKFCEELKEQGKIKYLGFSFHDSYEAFKEIIEYRDWDFCQIQYNYMDVNEQAGDKGYELAEKLGIPLVIMEPVKGGLLASLPEDARALFSDKNKSDASYALRFVASHKNVKVVLSGMSSEEQVDDNLSTFNNFKAFSDDEMTMFEKIRNLLNNKVKNGCTGCRYCMPCPKGVNIPRNFKVWNTYGMYGNKDNLKREYKGLMQAAQGASQCVKCGACEAKCPQKISIRNDLAMCLKEMQEICE